jgi:hypothetical protein
MPFRLRRSELARSSASSQVRRPQRGARMAVLGKGLPPETHGHKPPETASDPQISLSWDVGQRVLATASFDGEKRAPSCFSSIVPAPSAVAPSPYHRSFSPSPADAAEVVDKRSSGSGTFFYVHYSNCSPSSSLLFLLLSASTLFSRFFIALAQMTSAWMSGSKKTSSAPSGLVSTTTATP